MGSNAVAANIRESVDHGPCKIGLESVPPACGQLRPCPRKAQLVHLHRQLENVVEAVRKSVVAGQYLSEVLPLALSLGLVNIVTPYVSDGSQHRRQSTVRTKPKLTFRVF